MLQDSHDLNTVRSNTIIDRVCTAYAPSIAWSNMVNGRIQLRLLCQYQKSFLELLPISIRLCNAEMLVTVSRNGNQIDLGAQR